MSKPPNLPLWQGLYYGVSRADWVGLDAAGHDVAVPAMKIVLGGVGADAGFVSAANPLPVTFSGASSGDGAILDGASGGIRATVFDYANANPIAVRLTDENGDYVAPGGGVGGGLTDAQLRASAVPVSGTFYQATQPVSGTVAVTGTFWQATQPVSGPLTDAQLRAVAVPVSGTFWQATQPVSIAAAVPVTDNGGSLTVDGTVAVSGSVAVTGTFWQATQPVTLASLPALAAGTANIGDVDVLTLPAIPAGNNNIGDVDIASFPTLTKGTQGSTGVSVQNLRDAGRTLVVLTASALATVTTEALISLTPYRDLVAAGAATTHAVTGGKRLRLQALIVTARATSTVNVGGIVRLRMLAGTVLVTSPVHFSAGVMSSNLATAVAGNAQTTFIDLPEGFELSGTMQVGLTQLFSATSATIDVHLVGYEY